MQELFVLVLQLKVLQTPENLFISRFRKKFQMSKKQLQSLKYRFSFCCDRKNTNWSEWIDKMPKIVIYASVLPIVIFWLWNRSLGQAKHAKCSPSEAVCFAFHAWDIIKPLLKVVDKSCELLIKWVHLIQFSFFVNFQDQTTDVSNNRRRKNSFINLFRDFHWKEVEKRDWNDWKWSGVCWEIFNCWCYFGSNSHCSLHCIISNPINL